MNIGFVHDPVPSRGGVYGYGLNIFQALMDCKREEDELVVFAEPAIHDDTMSLAEGRRLRVRPIEAPATIGRQGLTMLRQIVGEGPHRETWRQIRRKLWATANGEGRAVPRRSPNDITFQPAISRWFRRCGVELMVYSETKTLSFECGLPYVMAIHDLQHRLQPEFPEVSANGEWESREYYLRNCSRYATLLMADSEVGKEDILNIYGGYGITPDRIKVLPYLPAPYVQNEISPSEHWRVRQRYNLPERYFFYPAQFWPHKNHLRIVHALAVLREEHSVKASIVFCGSHNDQIREETFNEVMRLAADLKVTDEVQYLGFVPTSDMSALYANAVALVMPTFFGPTNIPVLEAWALQCPVLTSDIRGLREQAGPAALLVNPRSVDSLADGLYRLWTEEPLRQHLIAEGGRRLSAYGPKDFQRRFMDILEEAKNCVKSGKIVQIPVAKGIYHQ